MAWLLIRSQVKGIESNVQSEKENTFRFVFCQAPAIEDETMAWEEAWPDPYGDDHALSGLWQRERIVFPGKSANGQRDRRFAFGGQQVAKLPENVQDHN